MLYHYCSNTTCFSILSGRNIRMSDISKSNASEELELFFPYLHRRILQRYKEKPFTFKYGGLTDIGALDMLVDMSEDIWFDRFAMGDFSNYVTCFSEKEDCLSQWRGYADNGKGCCIGFSKPAIEKYCQSTNGVLQLKKVVYLSTQEFEDVITSKADDILDVLKGLREWIIEEMTKDETDPDTDGLLGFNFNGMIEETFTESLAFKSQSFSEEDEWRLFFADQGYKNPRLVYRNRKEKTKGPLLFERTVDFLNNRIDFRWTDDDIIPFVPLNFCDFEEFPVSELWVGPKNKIGKRDLELLLGKYGYENVEIKFSNISYR